MASNVGWANAFTKAGLIQPSTETAQFSAISATSGGSWFALQFFYSKNFFGRALSSPDSAYDLVKQWMDSYLQFQRQLPSSLICQGISLFGFIQSLRDYSVACNTFLQVDFSWAEYVEGMVREASTNYGDPSLVDRLASHGNRIPTLAKTDILVQTSLAPTSIPDEDTNTFEERGGQPSEKDLVLIGPANSQKVFSTFVPIQYSVKANYSFYKVATEDGNLPLEVRQTKAEAPYRIRFNDWKDFYLYPGNDGDVFASSEPSITVNGRLADFFGGGSPMISQIMAASSATLGRFSGATPSYLVHFFSVNRYEYLMSSVINRIWHLSLWRTAMNIFYHLPQTRGTMVCSQWPAPCGKSDGWFADGGNTDGPSLALNIGQYQTVDAGSLANTMKVIVTNNNFFEDTNVKFLSYFSTTFNQGIPPGNFIWPPSTVTGKNAQENPWRSPQIFREYLDDESLLSAFVPIVGTNLTTAIYSVTTTNNPAFGTKAGQKVEILLLQINSNIPTSIFLQSEIEAWTAPLAELTKEIAASADLVSRIQEFLAD